MSLKNFLHKSSSLSDQNTTPARELKPALTELFVDILNSGSSLRVRVTGRSMAPFLMGGEIVTLEKARIESLRRGDLILFRDGQGLPFLHRLIKMDKMASTVQTKGDALRYRDRPVNSDNVLGRVCMIEKEKALFGLKYLNVQSISWRTVNYFIAIYSIIKSKL